MVTGVLISRGYKVEIYISSMRGEIAQCIKLKGNWSTHNCILIGKCSFYSRGVDDVNILVVERSDLIFGSRLNMICLDLEHVKAHRVLANFAEQWIDADLIVNRPLRVLQRNEIK